MIIIPLFDVALLLLNIFIAVVNRGTFWGWLATAFVFWQAWVLIKFVKEYPNFD